MGQGGRRWETVGDGKVRVGCVTHLLDEKAYAGGPQPQHREGYRLLPIRREQMDRVEDEPTALTRLLDEEEVLWSEGGFAPRTQPDSGHVAAPLWPAALAALGAAARFGAAALLAAALAALVLHLGRPNEPLPPGVPLV